MTNEIVEEKIGLIDRDMYEAIIASLDDAMQESSAYSLLELSILQSNFSHTELVSTIESEGFQISFFWKNRIENCYKITLLIDSRDLKSIINTLENKGYNIINSHNEHGYDDILIERYNHLMNYINI